MSSLENNLIARLPSSDRGNLLAHCETVDLALATILCEPSALIQYVYFPTGGIISLVALVDGHSQLEVDMIGNEGMLGSHLALGVVVAPLQALVQRVGSAWRLDVADFLVELGASRALQQCMQRYIYVRLAQLASSATCQRFHLVGPRLARWLLMSQDRANTDQFAATQAFLAHMLGVRRVSITVAATILQRQGLIAYRRGIIHILDRPRLEAAACSCYASEQKIYQTWLG